MANWFGSIAGHGQLAGLYQLNSGQWSNCANTETLALLGFRFATIIFRRHVSASLFLILYRKTSQPAD